VGGWERRRQRQRQLGPWARRQGCEEQKAASLLSLLLLLAAFAELCTLSRPWPWMQRKRRRKRRMRMKRRRRTASLRGTRTWELL
jgi:hypothetical protein